MKNLFCQIFGWAWIVVLVVAYPAEMLFRALFLAVVLLCCWACQFDWRGWLDKK